MAPINETKQSIAAGQYTRERDYWLDKLSGELVKTTLPYDRRGSGDKKEMKDVAFSIPDPLFARLNKISNNSDVRLHIILVAGWMMLLHKYTGHSDIILGMPTFRQKTDGQLINTAVALRGNVTGETAVKELLMKLGPTVLEADKNQNYPIDTLVYKLEFKREESGNDFPLFDISVLLEEIHDISYLDNIRQNVIVSFSKKSDRLDGVIRYNANVLKETTIRQVALHYHELIKNAFTDVTVPVAQVGMISDDERHKMLVEFNDNRAGFFRDKSIYRLVEEFSEETPDAPALSFEGEVLTYDQLNRKANKLARVLIKYGIKKDHTVGVLMERSHSMVISILAIWKAGSAYIPLDTTYPAQRLMEILTDSKTSVIMAKVDQSASALELKKEFKGAIIDPDYPVLAKDVKDGIDINEENPGIDVPMDSLSYVIYTSGSTGKPKGAMVEHIGMMNHIQSKINTLDIDEKSIVAQNASHTFDISVWQFFVALCRGGQTVIYSNSLVLDPGTFIQRIIDDELTILEVVPSYLTVLLDVLESKEKETGALPAWDIIYLLVTGEEVKPHLVTRWFEFYPGIPMVNAYGPTEASDDITHHVMTEAPEPDTERIPLGRSIQNLNIYIVDENMNLCPMGIKGEICVSGIGVGRGYLNDEEKTRNAFTTDPFSEEENVRLYKTGDLGCWLPDGTIDFFGRIDYQVKIRGFRIELGEIENRLLNHPAIKETVVMDREDDKNEKYLCGYIVPVDSQNPPDYLEIKRHLAESLPDYMIPAYIVTLDKMPLTPNGKIDRKALPSPETQISDIPYLSNDDVTRFMTMSHTETGGKALASKQISDPVVELLAEQTRIDTYNQTSDTVYLRLSHTQKMFYFLEKVHQQKFSSNLFLTVRYPGEVDPVHLENAVNIVLKKNAGIRHRIAELEIDGHMQPAQYAAAHESYSLNPVDFSQAGTEELVKWSKTIADSSFNLIEDNLFEFFYIRFPGNENGYGVKFHHLISDGWMMIMIIAEIHSTYSRLKNGETVDESPNPTYGEFLEDEKEYMISEKMKKDREFWHNVMLPLPPEVDLSFKKGTDYDTDTDFLKLPIPSELTPRMHKYAKAEESSIFKQLLTAFSIYISRVTLQNDFVIGSINHGRVTKKQKRTAGIFVDFFPMRVHVEPEMTFTELVDTNGGFLNYKIKNHIRYPYDILAQELRDITGVDTRYFGNVNLVDHANFQTDEYYVEHHPNGYDPNPLNIHVFHLKDDMGADVIEIEYEFHVSKFCKSDIRRIHNGLITIMANAMNDPGRKVSQIDILDSAGKELILETFNKTEAAFPHDKTLNSLFQDQVERTPGNIAVRGDGLDGQLTYLELNRRANQLARRLREQGVTTGKTAGIIIKRSFELITGIFAILKAGGAYIAFGLTYPDKRIQFMAEDCQILAILSDGTRDVPPVSRLMMDIREDKLYTGDHENLDPISCSTDPAAVFYTSGSTGNPKGIIVEHRGIVNRLYWYDQHFPMEEADSILQQTPATFDVSMWELFSWVFRGASLYFLNPAKGTMASHFIEAAISGQVTHMHIPPVYQLPAMDFIERNGLTASLSRLKYVNASGEALLPAHVNAFNRVLYRTNGTRLLNLYGPTEASIEVSCYDCSSDTDVDVVYIGKPIANIRLYIFDNRMNLCPVGITGKLYIAGTGVARGYVNHSDLNTEAFSSDPFVPGERMYFTGDFARWMPDGNIEFLGRIDNQVQLGGFRVEPGEIEDVLLKHKDIKEACVVPWWDEEQQRQFLCAFVEAREGDLEKSNYKEFVIRQLPLFMIPALYIQLDALPLTTSNKIDRKTLEKMVLYCQPGKENIASDILKLIEQGVVPVHGTATGGESLVGDEYMQIQEQPSLAGDEPGEQVAISEEEKHRVLELFNDTAAPYPEDKTITLLFEEQVEKSPESVAVTGAVQGNPLRAYLGMSENAAQVSVTYKQLNSLANRLARLLRHRGMATGAVTGIMVDRSIDMIIAMMAVLKAGSAYLAVPLTDPDQRIRYVFEDSGMQLMIKDSNRNIPLDDSVILNITSESYVDGETANLEPLAGSDTAASVFYTSGSTGKPKGVLLEHRGLVNRLNWMQRRYPLGKNDVILQKTAVVFDVSMWELFWWSFYGASLYLMPPGQGAEPTETVDAIHKGKVTTMHFTPTALQTFVHFLENDGIGSVSKLRTLRQVFVSGEALPASLVNRFNQILYNRYKTHLYNLYGPTEASIDVSFFDCSGSKPFEKIPIGKPIDNTRLYILAPDLNPLPVGVAGELHIAGVNLARGYLNRPELTAEKFIEVYSDQLITHSKNVKHSPAEEGAFPKDFKQRVESLYKTGDLCRWMEDGNIEFLGRIDHQVQVNGIRIELEEVEGLLVAISGVKEAVVVPRRGENGEIQLCGFVVAENEAVLTTSILRESLIKELPHYSVPSQFARLESIPLTATGKADRKLLSHIQFDTSGQEKDVQYVAPSSEMETKIAEIWKDVLNIERVGINDNFFDIGGNSLGIIQVSLKLKEAFNREIPALIMFEHSTIAAMVNYLEESETQDGEIMEETPEQEAEKKIEAQERAAMKSRGRNKMAQRRQKYKQK